MSAGDGGAHFDDDKRLLPLPLPIVRPTDRAGGASASLTQESRNNPLSPRIIGPTLVSRGTEAQQRRLSTVEAALLSRRSSVTNWHHQQRRKIVETTSFVDRLSVPSRQRPLLVEKSGMRPCCFPTVPFSSLLPVLPRGLIFARERPPSKWVVGKQPGVPGGLCVTGSPM